MRTPQQPSYSDGKGPVLDAMAHFRDKQRKQKLRARAKYFSRPEASAEAEALAARGRGGDSEIAHVTPGEIVLHPSMLSPETLAAVVHDLSRSGVGLGRVSVGSSDASVNPRTGLAEYRATGTTTWKVDPPKGVPNHVFTYDRTGRHVPDFRRPPNYPMPSAGSSEAMIGTRDPINSNQAGAGIQTSSTGQQDPDKDMIDPEQRQDIDRMVRNNSRDYLIKLKQVSEDASVKAQIAAGVTGLGAVAATAAPPISIALAAGAGVFSLTSAGLEYLNHRIDRRLSELDSEVP